ncbi:MAG TPA: response regulator [Vicinamibacterales bacterium]|jgi:PAS domain S-box-containing protein
MDPGIAPKSVDDLRRRLAELEAQVEHLRRANEALQQIDAPHERLDAALREAGALLTKSQAIAHVGSWILDLPTGRLVWSDETFRIFGLEAQEFAATYEAFLEAVHPDDRAAVDDAYSRSVREAADSYDIEHRIVRRHSGEIRVVHERCEHEWDASGAIVRSIGMVQDITERKHLEEERQRLQGQLLQSQKLESIGRLAGGVAHDFNNMLCVILGRVELALAQGHAADAMHEDLVAIEHAARRSADMVSQLLAFAGKQPIAPRVMDLGEAVGGMLTMLRRLIGENITLVWTPDGKAWPVRIDPAQLSQLLAGLCLNARDAIVGTGTVRVEATNVTVARDHPAARAGGHRGDYVLLAVADDGRGMEAEVVEHLFEPFFTTKGVGRGPGLGLSSIHGIVSQNGRFIDVESSPGSGSTFSIYLPRHTACETPTRGGRPEAPADRGRETILLVEDEPSILKMAQRMLEARGYTVLTAKSPGEALELAQAHSGDIHLVVTDVIMPGMNGRELATRLSLLHPKMKRVFMSGYAANVIANDGMIEEGVQFIPKPFSATALATKVRAALGQA